MHIKDASVQSVVEPTVKEVDGLARLHAVVDPDTNALNNPLFDADRNYPIGALFNGVITNYYPGGEWAFNSPLATNTGNYSSIGGYGWSSIYKPYKDSATFGGEPNTETNPTNLINIKYTGGRALKLYGVGASIDAFNRDPDRAESTYPGITSFTSSSKTVDGTTTWEDADCWAKYEWFQQVHVPLAAATYKFGALVRCPAHDPLRQLNFGGIYTTHDHAPVTQNDTKINCIAIKRASHNLSLRTGNIPSSQTPYNWSGLHPNYDDSTERYYTEANLVGSSSVEVENITYKDAEDFSEYKLVTSTATITSTVDQFGLGIFFAENHSYLPMIPPDPNPPTGSIEFYSPFIQFFRANGELII